MLFAFSNVRSTFEATFLVLNLSRAFLVGQLLVQCAIKHVLPCVCALNTHEVTPGNLNLFLLDLSAMAAIPIFSISALTRERYFCDINLFAAE